MPHLTEPIQSIMNERFGRDVLLALATVSEEHPYVRTVNAYYEDGAFYVVTHALSAKMRQISQNPSVALCGEWFTGHGEGINLGFFGKPENTRIAQTLRRVFSGWLDNGHTDLEDQNTVILCVRLTEGVLLSHGTRYEIHFQG